MQHLTKTNFRLIISFSLLTAFAACTTADEGKKMQEEKVIETVMLDTAFSGTLDTLYADSSTFAAMAKEPIVFSFAFRGKDTLTLYGWSSKPGGPKKPHFNGTPDIKLKKAKASTLKYGPNVIFGNLVLTKADVDNINDSLKIKQAKYVLFAPSKNGDGIEYTIYVSKDEPTALAKMAIDPTGVKANPTPPKPWE